MKYLLYYVITRGIQKSQKSTRSFSSKEKIVAGLLAGDVRYGWFGKAGKLQTIKPDEALEEALCFGWWIDG